MRFGNQPVEHPPATASLPHTPPADVLTSDAVWQRLFSQIDQLANVQPSLSAKNAGSFSDFNRYVFTPREIKAKLDQHVIAQDKPKMVLATVAYEHFKRVGMQIGVPSVQRAVASACTVNSDQGLQFQMFCKMLTRSIRKYTLSSATVCSVITRALRIAEEQGLVKINPDIGEFQSLADEIHTAHDLALDMTADKILDILKKEQSVKEMAAPSDVATQLRIDKQNVLLIGGTGTGKTELARALANILQVPFVAQNASQITSQGYIGGKAEDVIEKLLCAADGQEADAERGIVFMDEIDKLKQSRGNANADGKDVNGKGAQDSLLKLMEDTEVSVGRKKVKTDNILYIFAGAFNGLCDHIAERLCKDIKGRIGFGDVSQNALLKPANKMTAQEKKALLKYVTPEDVVAFGFSSEFVGRVPIIITMEEMTAGLLKRVLVEPKNSLVKQYTEKLALEGITFRIEEEVYSAIADYALKLNTGARGLASVMQTLLGPALYSAPDLEEGTNELVLTGKMAREIIEREYNFKFATDNSSDSVAISGVVYRDTVLQ